MAIQKQTATTFKGTKRNRGRTCVKVKTDTKGNTRKTKGGGKLKDSGVRFAGCFSNAADAKARVAAIKAGGSLKSGGRGRKGKKKYSKKRKK